MSKTITSEDGSAKTRLVTNGDDSFEIHNEEMHSVYFGKKEAREIVEWLSTELELIPKGFRV